MRAVVRIVVGVLALAGIALATDLILTKGSTARGVVVAGIPAGRLGKPEEIAQMVVFLASEHGAFATGATFAVNGGQYMA